MYDDVGSAIGAILKWVVIIVLVVWFLFWLTTKVHLAPTVNVQGGYKQTNGQQQNNPQGQNNGSQVYTFQWASGDLFGEHAMCHVMISEADGTVNVPSSHGTIATGQFNAASKQVYDNAVSNIQANANPGGSCDIVAQPSNLPFS